MGKKAKPTTIISASLGGAVILSERGLDMAGITLSIGWAIVLWVISGILVLFAGVIAFRAYALPFLRREKANKSELKVTITNIKIGEGISNDSFLFLVTVKLQPSAPIQLGKLDLVYDRQPYAPMEFPTKLVERVETYEVKYKVSGFRGDFLLETGLREEKNVPENEWPQAYLHVIAGELNFNTDKVPIPTPNARSTPDKEEPQT